MFALLAVTSNSSMANQKRTRRFWTASSINGSFELRRMSRIRRVRESFGSEEEYEAKRKQAGLREQEVRAMVASQLYLSNYLDSRFRPAVQVDPKEIEDFYQTAVVARAKARGQEPPTLDAARDSIQEALIQNGINQQAELWLKESRLRLHVEKFLDEVAK